MNKTKSKPKTKLPTLPPFTLAEIMLIECALETNLRTMQCALDRTERCKAALKELRVRLVNQS